MKKCLFSLAAVLAVLAFSLTPSHAAVEGSKHDMVAMAVANAAYNNPLITGANGLCSACHLPHKAGGLKLWPKVPPAVSPTFGTLGFTCAYCHDGGIIANQPADMSQTVFVAGVMSGHGMGGTAAGSIGDLATIRTSTMPYTSALATDTYMECVSCHSVHNSYPAARPFLEAKAPVTGLNDLCVVCHAGKDSVAMSSGKHPSDIAGTITGDITGPGNSPIVTPLSGIMQTPAGGTGLVADPVWNAGPHLTSGANNGVYCNSCHNVHGDEGGNIRLTTKPYGSALLAFDPNTGVGQQTANAFCEACHQGGHGQAPVGTATTSWPNPGLGTTAFHPADDDDSNGATRIVAIATPAGWVFGTGQSGVAEVLCTTCHGVHNNNFEGTTFAGTPALRASGAGAGTVQTNFCGACHTTVPADCFHTGHIGGDTSGGTWAAMQTGGATGFGTVIGTGTASTDCNLCHRAHNAPGQHVMRKVYTATSTVGVANPDQICVDCHTSNPSVYTTFGGTGTTGTDLASHFVGNVTLATGSVGFPTNGFGTTDLVFSAQKTNAWPNNALSVYGSPDTAKSNKGIVVCTSCHAIGNTCGTSSTTASVTRTGDATGTYMMIAPSGNPINAFGTAVNRGDTVDTSPNYLCTGCHGENAFAKNTALELAGTTHPLLAVTATTTVPVGTFGGTLTTGNHINCESCHRAHDASTKSGSYILEKNTGADTVIVGSNTVPTMVEPAHAHNKFCSSCHSSK